MVGNCIFISFFFDQRDLLELKKAFKNNIFTNGMSTSHPLIPNSNQYFLEKKYVSIHSEDRDIIRYPNSAEFEITLPQDYLNVASARLFSWSFPANYNVFSSLNYNISMTFKMLTLYNPRDHGVIDDPVADGIYAALLAYQDGEILFTIEPGFYNPDQMLLELTNKFNDAMTRIIDRFFLEPENLEPYAGIKVLFDESGGYQRFKVVYNAVSQKLWFGNNADRFVLTNESNIYLSRAAVAGNCLRKGLLPELANWGLPAYLGFTRCNAIAQTADEYLEVLRLRGITSIINFGLRDGVNRVNEFSLREEDGYWLLPDMVGADVYFLEAPFKISFMGPAYMYMEIEGWNCLDETSPYNLSTYTVHNNQTNGVVSSSFAKIPIPTTPISQWFDSEMGSYKYWNPPAERLRKLCLKIRYHNGTLVEFGQFEYSFVLELNVLRPQQQKNYSIVNASDLGQLHSYNK